MKLQSVVAIAAAVVLLFVAAGRAQPDRNPSDVPMPPAPPSEFRVPESDPAGPIARQIASWTQRRPRWRAQSVGATWVVDPSAAWSIRPDHECLADLEANGVPFEAWRPAHMVPTPVRVTPPRVHDVNFHMPGPAIPIWIACETALRLAVIADVVKRHGITDVYISSALRRDPSTSFHAVGMGLDLPLFRHPDGLLSVERDFVMNRDVPTCGAAPPEDWRGRALLEIACELHATRRFSTVLTPNYNAGHRDHFHVDIRPDDPRFFLR